MATGLGGEGGMHDQSQNMVSSTYHAIQGGRLQVDLCLHIRMVPYRCRIRTRRRRTTSGRQTSLHMLATAANGQVRLSVFP